MVTLMVRQYGFRARARASRPTKRVKRRVDPIDSAWVTRQHCFDSSSFSRRGRGRLHRRHRRRHRRHRRHHRYHYRLYRRRPRCRCC